MASMVESFRCDWGNPFTDPMTIFMALAVGIPPIRTFMGGWTNFTVSEGHHWELIAAYFTDPYFLIATASVVLTIWLSHRDGYVKLSVTDRAVANWYLLCGAYIHFLMDGLVGCYGAWGLMRRAYETLDGRFPHARVEGEPYTVGVQAIKAFDVSSSASLGTPPPKLRQQIPNWSVPFVVGHMEMLVYFPMCLALYYAYKKGLPWRRPLEIVVASFQLFGAIVFMGTEEVTGSSNLFVAKHETGLGFVPTGVPWWDVACFYWFAYFFCNLIWVFVPIPLIWKAITEISQGEIVTNMPLITAEGMTVDTITLKDLEAIPDDARLELLGEDADGNAVILVATGGNGDEDDESSEYDKED